MSAEKMETKEKPLEKMTVTDLREMAKEELIVAIKKFKGIVDEPTKKTDATLGEIKKKIKAVKTQRLAAIEAKDKKMAKIYKRRISRLKKKSRRAAA